jgi:polyisoprenoid-binding protein YceI
MKLAYALAFTTLFSFPALAAEEKYTLDPTHTNITWSANHFGFSNPSGKFSKVEGTLTLDEAKPEASKVNVTITPASVITGVEKLDEHLRTDAFFDVAKFPTATFVSDKVDVTGKGTAKITGNLTLHGVSKPVVLDVTLNKIGENPISKKKTAGFSASTTILRSDFGINYALPGVSDEVKIKIEAEVNLQ